MLVLLIVLMLSSGCGGPEAWCSYGGDGSRSLCSQSPGPIRPQLVWAVDLQGSNPGTPVVDGEGVYVSHSGGSVSKFNLLGEMEWRFDSWVCTGDLPPHLVLLGDMVLVSSQGALEETFSLNNQGKVSPDVSGLPWPASMSPAVNSSGYAVVCHQYISQELALSLRVYGTKGGSSIWHWDFSVADEKFLGSNPVLLEDGRAFVFIESGGQNSLVAWDSTGNCLWQRNFPASGVGQAIAASQDGVVIFGTRRIEDISKVYSPGELYAINSAGEVLWHVEGGQRVEQIFISGDLIVANMLRTKLLALNMKGEELWQYPLAGWESNGVMDNKGRTYLAGVNENIVFLRCVDKKGRELWQLDTGQRAESISCLALANGVLYLATNCGKLLAIADK